MKCAFFRNKNKYLLAISGLSLIWAMIYLPSISVPDISRNECRRVLPAMTMLDTGNWTTPMLAGKPYYRKPPLMNWIIGASYVLTGRSNVLMARIPTTLIILAFSIMLLFMPSGILDFKSRFISAATFLTSFGLIPQGRSANIDPNYVCLAGAAILLWLNGWSNSMSGWRKWLPSSIPLALGILLKGPLILLVYYVFIVTLLILDKKKRELYSLPHILSIVFALLPFCIWSYYAKQGHVPDVGIKHTDMGNVWYHEILYRFNFSAGSFGKWSKRVLGGFLQFMPYLLIFVLLWNKKIMSKLNDKQLIYARSSLISVILLFILINAMPGTKARYSLPLLPLIVTAFGLLVMHIPVPLKWIKVIRQIFQYLFYLIGGMILFLFISFIVLKTLIPVDSIDNIKLQKILITFSSVSIFWVIIQLFMTFSAFLFYKKNQKYVRNVYGILITFVFAVGLTVSCCFIYIFPMALTFKHNALDTAKSIDNSCSKDAIVCGVGFVGEEPFVAHIQHKWCMVDNLSNLNEPLRVFIINEELLDDLDKFKNRFSMHEVARKAIHYKKHKYHLIKLEKIR